MGANFQYHRGICVVRSVFCHGCSLCALANIVRENVRNFFCKFNRLLNCYIVARSFTIYVEPFVTVNSEIFAVEQGPLYFLFHAELVDTS